MGKKILLADDSITIQKVIELTFSDEDFEVVTVGNGRLAIERLPEARPDLVLCDIIMPEKDGYEVCDFIKKHPTLSHTPVLLLTGAFEPFDQERAARVGCDGYLAKPFEPQTLIAKVKELLARSGSRPAAASAPAPAPTPAPAPAAATPPTPPSAPAWSAPSPAPSFTIPPSVPEPEPEPEPEMDDFAPGAVFGSTPTDIHDYDPGAEGTVRAPAFQADDDPYASADAGAGAGKVPASLDELYDDDPYGAAGGDELMPLSDDEAESVAPPVKDAPGSPWRDEKPTSAGPEEPAPWAQPTIEVPLEMRAQAGVESAQLAADGYDEVFDAEAANAARERAEAPAPAPTPAAPPAVEQGLGAAPSPAAAPAVPPEFGWVRDAEVAAAPPAPAPAPAPFVPEIPVSSFRDVAPAEEEDKTSITRSVAGEVQVPVDMVEKIAQRVVAQISEKVIREIAWEVIPDLAEALIKREIDRLKAELQQT